MLSCMTDWTGSGTHAVLKNFSAWLTSSFATCSFITVSIGLRGLLGGVGLSAAMLKCFLLCIARSVECVNTCSGGVCPTPIPLSVLHQAAFARVPCRPLTSTNRATAHAAANATASPTPSAERPAIMDANHTISRTSSHKVFRICALRLQHSFSSLFAADYAAPPSAGSVVSPVHSGDG